MTVKAMLLLLVAAAMAADLASFVLVDSVVGIEHEVNPLIVAAHNVLGLAAVAWLKVGFTVVLLVLVSRLHRGWMLASAASVAIFFGLLGAYGNISTYLAAS